MREIKFRCWNKEEKNMYRVMGISYYDVKLDITLDDIQNVNVDAGASYSIEDIELMQSTGLKDKNDKDIYEGDIVKFQIYQKDISFEIKYVDGSYIAINEKYFYQKIYYINSEIIKGHFVEVIGNIYENPELLELKK